MKLFILTLMGIAIALMIWLVVALVWLLVRECRSAPAQTSSDSCGGGD